MYFYRVATRDLVRQKSYDALQDGLISTNCPLAKLNPANPTYTINDGLMTSRSLDPAIHIHETTVRIEERVCEMAEW